jgi:hypothetical protein
MSANENPPIPPRTAQDSVDSMIPDCFSITTMQQVIDNDGKTPDWVVEGLLPLNGLQVISGRAKSRKSWLAIDQCLSIASGTDWLGFKTSRRPSIYVNFELGHRTLANRIKLIADAKKINLLEMEGWFLPLTVNSAALAGACAEAGLEEGFTWQVLEQIKRGMAEGFDLERLRKRSLFLMLDSFYNFINIENDNNAGQVAGVYRLVRNFQHQHFREYKRSCAAAVVHHFAKGAPGDKMAGDLAAGSRVHRQEPNAYIEIVEHREQDCFVFAADLRDYPPVRKMGLRWETPLLTEDMGLDLNDIKKPPGRGRPKGCADKDVWAALIEPMTAGQWELAAMDKTGIGRSTFYEVKKRLVAAEKVTQKDGKWSQITH